MAKKEFILQGFTKRTHGDVIRELFDVFDIQRVLVSVAFVSDSGVQQIEAQLKSQARKVIIFACVRNEITSYQGLKRLISIKDSAIYAVDTGSRHVVFHPKLYLVRGKARARLSVGSANLTLGGLNNNIEAGMMLDFDLNVPADKAVVDCIETQLTALPTEYPEHIKRIKMIAELDELVASGRVVDEMATPPPRPSTSASSGGATDAVPRIKLKVTPLRRNLAKAKRVPTVSKAKSGATLASKGLAGAVATAGFGFDLVWESKPLRRRDLQIPDGANTAVTGSKLLGKGAMDQIDPVTYFREDIFGHLKWSRFTNRAGNVAEKADAQFQLWVKGENHGTFSLTISHSLKRVRAAKKDKNSPTELRWNDAAKMIARPDLLDRTMRLYRDIGDPMDFAIEID